MLYLWGAAYYDGYLSCLGFREGAPRLDTSAYLVASWRALASASLFGLTGILIFVAVGFTTNLWSALVDFRVASRARKEKAPAADHARPSSAPTVLGKQVNSAATSALRQLALLAGVAIALAVALYETVAMEKYGREAAVATLTSCRDASITFDGSPPEQMKYCTRLGDQIVLMDDTVPILVDASRVVRIALSAGYRAGQGGSSTRAIGGRKTWGR